MPKARLDDMDADGIDTAVLFGGGPLGTTNNDLFIASFEWWTEQFAAAGFTRCTDVEVRLYADIEPADLAQFWNLYVFRTSDADPSVVEPREPGRTLAEIGLLHPLLGT